MVKLVLNSYVFLGFCAVAKTYETILLNLHGSSILYNYLILVFVLVVLAYSVKSIRALYSNVDDLKKEKVAWVINNKRLLLTIIVIGVLISIVSLVRLPIQLLFLLLPVGVVTVNYSYPLMINNKSYTIRIVPYLKTFLVAIVWTSVTCCVPLFLGNVAIENVLIIGFGEFLFYFSLTILFDIKDIESDKNLKLKTLANRIGPEIIKKLGVLVLVIRLLYLRVFEVEYVNWNMEFLYFVFYGIVVYRLSSKEENYYMFYLDGLMPLKTLLYCMAILF